MDERQKNNCNLMKLDVLPELIRRELIFNDVLGRGSKNSLVVKGVHKKTLKEVAVKMILKMGMTLTEVERQRE
jgi:hypothetical protein